MGDAQVTMAFNDLDENWGYPHDLGNLPSWYPNYWLYIPLYSHIGACIPISCQVIYPITPHDTPITLRELI